MSKGLNLVKSMESLDTAQRIIKIADMLESQGFNVEYRRRQHSKKNIVNYFYSKDGVDYVYCVIYKLKENQIYYTLIDYSTYRDVIIPNPDIILNWVIRQMGDLKIVMRSEKFINVPVHRVAVDCAGREINHKTHNACINISEYLNVCSSAENSRDKVFYSRVSDDMKSFSVPVSVVNDNERINLLSKNYKVYRGRVYSPEFESTEEMYTALNAFEDKFLGKYRYNPLVDFSDTWYALVIQKMFGDISDVDLYEYNREYMIKNHADITEYYQLTI